MKFSRAAMAIAIATTLTGLASAAQATPLLTLTWSGTTGFGTDGGPAQFGFGNFASLAGKAFSIALSYDPTALTNDSCGVSANTNCNWQFGAGGVTETITINSITHTYAATGGNIGLGVGAHDQINLSASGGSQFGLNVTDNTSFFASLTNANNPIYNFTNVAVTGNWGSSNLGGSASIGGSLTTLSAVYNPGTSHVPEPASLALFGAGLMGATAMLRRRRKLA